MSAAFFFPGIASCLGPQSSATRVLKWSLWTSGKVGFACRAAASRTRFIDVELRRVRLALGERMVLRGIDWRIAPGQRWVLMGANGAGKTQLLKLLAGDVWPSPAGGSLRRYRLGGETFDDPYGIKEEIAYLGAERQDRYEHYEWNHRVRAHRRDRPASHRNTAGAAARSRRGSGSCGCWRSCGSSRWRSAVF